MRIAELELLNLSNHNLFSLKFNDTLTLLVGMSGVGKTRILNSIYFMKKIVLGDIKDADDFTWKLTFFIGQEKFLWSGKSEKGMIIEESLFREEKQVFGRTPDSFGLQGISIPKISGNLSILSVFWGVDTLKAIYDELVNIYMINTSNIPEDSHVIPAVLDDPDITDIVSLYYSDYSIYEKLAVAWSRDYEVFNEIKEDFITVFPMVEDMKFDYDRKGRELSLFIKEMNTDWISHGSLSAGMKKSLYHIACLSLLPEGSLLLIDELENSMGVRCLDLVSDMFNSNTRDFQIILTSHHPYVINNVDMVHWQVVLRNENKIYTKNKDELGLGRSHHDAFKQLMNLDEFMEGNEK